MRWRWDEDAEDRYLERRSVTFGVTADETTVRIQVHI